MSSSLNQNCLILASHEVQTGNYRKAITLYLEALKDPSLPLPSQLLVQLSISILYIRINDYAQAHQILTELSLRVATVKSTDLLQQTLISIKIEACLTLIELANLHTEQVFLHIQTILTRINEWASRDIQSMQLLFRSAMKILFGFHTFAEISSHKSLDRRQLHGNEIWMLSLALNRQISGDIESAYQLSHQVYEYSKTRTIVIVAALACQHLLHLSHKLNLSKTVISMYENQLAQLMNTPQIYGISGQTLFRNYQQKIQCGSNVAEIMQNFEAKLSKNYGLNHTQISQIDHWLSKILIKKLNGEILRIQKDRSFPTKNQQIELLKKVINNLSVKKQAYDILKFMNNTEFITQIKNQETLKIKKFNQILHQYTNKVAWKVMIMLPPKIIDEIDEEMLTEQAPSISVREEELEKKKRMNYEDQDKNKKRRVCACTRDESNNVASNFNRSNKIDYETFMKQHKQKELFNKTSENITKLKDQEWKLQKTPEKRHKSPKLAQKREYASVIPHNNKNKIKINQINNSQIHNLSNFINQGNQIYMEKDPKHQQSYLSQMMLVNKFQQQKYFQNMPQQNRNTATFLQEQSNNYAISQPRTEHPLDNKQKKKEKKQGQNFLHLFQKQECATIQKEKIEGSQGNISKTNIMKMIAEQKIQNFSPKMQQKPANSIHQNNSIHPSNLPLSPSLNKKSLNKSSQDMKQSKWKKIKSTDSHMIENVSKLLNQGKMKKFMKMCQRGQYFIKRHFSSDGGEQKYVQLTNDMIKWAINEEKISTKFQDYKLKEIKGVCYGKVSQTFLKECNKKLEPWKCFSLILKKRTLDFYCTQEIDPYIWIPGITASLEGQKLPLGKYGQVKVSVQSPGKILWKRFLLKLQSKYIKPFKSHERNHIYCNANAYAIIMFGKSMIRQQNMVSQSNVRPRTSLEKHSKVRIN